MPATVESILRSSFQEIAGFARGKNLPSVWMEGETQVAKPHWRRAAHQSISLIRLVSQTGDIPLLPELQAPPVGDEWQQLNTRRIDLIDKKEAQPLSANEARELEQLQNQLYEKRKREVPLPIAQLKAIREELKREGLWSAP